MKSILISIQPSWCRLILEGKKTVEVRKTKPQIKPPFKCYIYCTKDRKQHFWIGALYSYVDDHSHNTFDKCGNGKIIGAFVCDEITTFPEECSASWLVANSCVTAIELGRYAGDNDNLYAWHISDLVVYDEPRALSELKAICRHYDDGLCGDCEYYDYANNESYRCEECAVDGLKPITKPPQSWCYVKGE